jgi:hypothetical protein
MFGRYEDAYLSGQFRVVVETETQPDGTFISRFTAPNGHIVEAASNSLADSHNKCTELVRRGVMDQSINLGR